MKIFLSWSGDRSKLVAMALRDWIPLVLHYTEPWLSEKDIGAGDRWTLEVGKRLEESSFGIICLTRENLDAPWILFEAGALSKAIATSAVCPYLVDVDFADIVGPLSQFQAKKTQKKPTFELIQAINQKAVNAVEGTRLVELFEVLWPKLENCLAGIPPVSGIEGKLRSPAEILEELVAAVRTIDHRLRNLDTRLAQDIAAPRGATRLRTPKLHYGFPVQIYGSEDLGRVKKGEKFPVIISGPEFIDEFAIEIGLNPKDYGVDWYLYNPKRNKTLERDNCSDLSTFFGEGEAVLWLTTIPF